jgi:hypothetical protein
VLKILVWPWRTPAVTLGGETTGKVGGACARRETGRRGASSRSARAASFIGNGGAEEALVER